MTTPLSCNNLVVGQHPTALFNNVQDTTIHDREVTNFCESHKRVLNDYVKPSDLSGFVRSTDIIRYIPDIDSLSPSITENTRRIDSLSPSITENTRRIDQHDSLSPSITENTRRIDQHDSLSPSISDNTIKINNITRDIFNTSNRINEINNKLEDFRSILNGNTSNINEIKNSRVIFQNCTPQYSEEADIAKSAWWNSDLALKLDSIKCPDNKALTEVGLHMTVLGDGGKDSKMKWKGTCCDITFDTPTSDEPESSTRQPENCRFTKNGKNFWNSSIAEDENSFVEEFDLLDNTHHNIIKREYDNVYSQDTKVEIDLDLRLNEILNGYLNEGFITCDPTTTAITDVRQTAAF